MNSKYLNNSQNESSFFTEENQATDLMQKLGNLEKMYPKMASLAKPKSSLDLKTKFFNQCFDKGRLKNFVLWFLLNYGENETVSLVEQLKNIGFLYASKAGISLGIDDLKIPPKKSDLIYDAEKQTKLTVNQYVRGEITGIERFQRLIDTWHRTSEILKQEVIKNFEATDLLNPVYMMAFSGARGNISQVRQLVGMRGLMADPQGQILDFPIRSNFREGLTLTEYIISSYGARKGIVDTALRTANAGYLTRRLVDVAQHVIIAKFDCGTRRGIFLVDMKEGNKTIHSLTQRAVGRILARDLFIVPSTSNDPTSKIKMASRNEEITSELATEIGKKFEKVFVRSPLTCETSKLICQLCYGWSLAQGNLVSIGEAVGVVAAQSIGEPGTQLTMRTFHTGGVFSGDISDQIRAPFTGVVEYLSAIPGTLIRTPEGKIVFLTKSEGSFVVHKLETGSSAINNNESSSVNKKFKIPNYTLLFIRNGQTVTEKEVIAQISSISQKTNATDYAELTIKSEMEGQFYSQSLTFSEKEVGPKLTEKISSRQSKTLNSSLTSDPNSKLSQSMLTTKNSLADEKIYEAWTWGYAWILSGKIYEFKYPSPFFTQMGDYLSSKSAMNQTLWKLSDTTGKRGNKLSYHTNAFSLNFPSLKSQRLLEKNSHFARHEVTAKLNTKETPCSISQSVLSFDLETSLFKKYGYYLKLSKKNQFFAISSTEALSSFKSSYAGKAGLTQGKNNQDLVFFMKSLKNSFFPESNLSSAKTSSSGGSLNKNRSSSSPNQGATALKGLDLDSSANLKEKFKMDIPYFLQWFPSPTQTLTGGYAFSIEAPFLTSGTAQTVHHQPVKSEGTFGLLKDNTGTNNGNFATSEQLTLFKSYKNSYQSNRFILTSNSAVASSTHYDKDWLNNSPNQSLLSETGSLHNQNSQLFNFKTRSISSTWKSSILKQLQAADLTETSSFDSDKTNKSLNSPKGNIASFEAKMYSQEFVSFKKSYFFGMRWKNNFSLWTDINPYESNEVLENKIMDEKMYDLGSPEGANFPQGRKEPWDVSLGKHNFGPQKTNSSKSIYWVPSEFFKIDSNGGFKGNGSKKGNHFSTVLLKNTNSNKTNGFVNEKIPFLIQTNRQGHVKAFNSVMEENLSTFLISSFGFSNRTNKLSLSAPSGGWEQGARRSKKGQTEIKVGLKHLKLKQTSRRLKELSLNSVANGSLSRQIAARFLKAEEGTTSNFYLTKQRFLSSERKTYLKSLLSSSSNIHSKETNLQQEILLKAMFSNAPLLKAFESKFYIQTQRSLNFSHLTLSELTKFKQTLSMKKFKYHLTAQNLHSTSLKLLKNQKENFFIDQIKLCPFLSLNTYCQILSLLFETNLTNSKMGLSGQQSGSVEQQLKQLKFKNQALATSTATLQLLKGHASKGQRLKAEGESSAGRQALNRVNGGSLPVKSPFGTQLTKANIKTNKKELLLKNLQKFILVSNYLNKESQKVSGLKNKDKFALFLTGQSLGNKTAVSSVTLSHMSQTVAQFPAATLSQLPLVKSTLCVNKKVFVNPSVNLAGYDLTSLHNVKNLSTQQRVADDSQSEPSAIVKGFNSFNHLDLPVKNQWSQKKGWVYCQKMISTNQKTANQLLNSHNKLIYPGQHFNFLCFDSPVTLFTQCILLTSDSKKNGAEEAFVKQKSLKQFKQSNQTTKWNEKTQDLLWVRNKKARYYFTDEKSYRDIETPSETQIGLFIQPIEEYQTINSLEMKKHIFEGMSNTYTTFSAPMENTSNFKVPASGVRIEKKVFDFTQKYYVNKSADSFLKWKQTQTSVFNKQEKTSQPYAMYPNSDFSLVANCLFSESLSLAQIKTASVSSNSAYGSLGQRVTKSTMENSFAFQGETGNLLSSPNFPILNGGPLASPNLPPVFGRGRKGLFETRSPHFKFGSQKPLNLSSYMVLLSSTFGNISPFKHQSYSLNSLPLLKADLKASSFSSDYLLRFFNFYLDLTQSFTNHLFDQHFPKGLEKAGLVNSLFLSNPISKIYENPAFTFNTVFKFNTHLLLSEKTTFFKTNLKKHSHRNTALFPQNKMVTSTTQFTYDVNNDLHSNSIIAKTTDLSPFNGEVVYTNFANTGFFGSRVGEMHEKSSDQTFVHKPSSNYNCMILTKRDLISYYLPSQNFKNLLNPNLPKKYKINDIFVKQFLTTNEFDKAGEANLSSMTKTPVTQNVQLKVSNLAAGTPQPFSSSLLGDFFVFGDLLGHTKAIQTSGQIIHYNNQKITLRRAQPIFISPKAILHKLDGDFIDPKSPVITLSYQRLKTGDIIQGIPKVEQFFEARTTKRGRLFRDSLPSLLKSLFKRYQAKLPLELAVRQSFYKIQQILVDGVQRVYKSQGVTIADKHLEVIVKQMTSKVRIVDGAQTGFFPGEVVDLEFVEKINKYLIKKITYEPLVLGITKASLEVDSFLSAASFQQTTRVLSKAAIYRKKDFLKGLKENVILGNLIPAGTGFLVYLDDNPTS